VTLSFILRPKRFTGNSPGFRESPKENVPKVPAKKLFNRELCNERSFNLRRCHITPGERPERQPRHCAQHRTGYEPSDVLDYQ
jgi:hypothetical protein